MIGEIYTCAIQGTHCGAPFSVSLAYLQIANVQFNGQKIAEAFWDPAAGPGKEWLALSSNKFKPQCMSWSSPTDIGAALLDNRVGGINTPAMPPVAAVLYHIRPLTPHPGPVLNKPKYDIGRFYLPGLVVSQCDRFALNATAITAYSVLGGSIRELLVGGNPAFRLVPFPKFVAPQGGEVTARSCVPDSLIRRIPTRRPNVCELFAGAGQVGGRPVI